MKQLTVVKLSSVHNVMIDRLEKQGAFITAYQGGEIVAGFSTEAVDEFYVRETVAAVLGGDKD